MNLPLSRLCFTAVLASLALVVRPAAATTTTYPYTDPNPPFETVSNWDATTGIAGGDTIVLQNNSTYSSSVNPITNSGTLELNAGIAFNNPYEFSLGMTGTGGVLISGGFALLTGTNSYTGGTVIDGNGGGTLIATTSSLNGFVNNTGILRFQQNFNGTFSGTLIGGGQLQRFGTGTVTLSGSIATPFETYNDSFGGRLVGTTDTIKGVVRNDGANLEFAQNLDGTFQGDFGQSIYGNVGDTGNVYKTGTGALTLTGNNRFTIAGQSDMFIQAGRVQGPVESLDFNGTITISAGAELRIIQNAEINNMLQSEITGAGNVYKTGTGTADLTQPSNSLSGTTTVAQGQMWFTYNSLPAFSGTYSDIVLSGSGPANSAGITIYTGGSVGQEMDYSGYVSGPGSLTVAGINGGLLMTGSSNYTGGTYVEVGRVIGNTQTMPGPITLLGDGAEICDVEYRQNTNATVAYAITGTGVVYKTGTGALTLTADTNLNGAVYARGGSLVINNSMPNIALTRVEQGGVLMGSGTIGSNQQFFVGIEVVDGILSPGNSPGILTTNDLDLSSDSTTIWELTANTASAGARGTSFDGVNLTNGNLTIDTGADLSLVFNAAGSNVSWFSTFWDANQSWVLIDNVANPTLQDPNAFTNIVVSLDSVGRDIATFRPGATFTTTVSGGDLVIGYTAAALVPEPATLSLVAFGGLGCWIAVRRRRR
jgi:autotransporter-associated beta strand protein